MPDYISNANILNFATAQTNSSMLERVKATNNVNGSSDLNWQDTSTLGVGPERNPRGTELDRDAFLHLLITQLQFQDPLNPMEDTDFISQLAQFSSLEQAQQMNNNTVRTQAFNMVGNPVLAHVYNEQTNRKEEVIGIVEAVTIRSGEPRLVIGEREVSMDDIVSTTIDPTTLQLISAINNQLFTAQNVELIGQYAQFLQRDEDGEIIGFVEGKVDSLKFDQNSGLILMIGSNEVSATELKTVSSTPLLIGRVITGSTSANEPPITGSVKDVSVINGRISLVLEGGNIPINNITHVTDALRHVDTQITHGDMTGIVEHVRINRGDPYLVLDSGEQISFLEFAGIEEEDDDED